MIILVDLNPTKGSETGKVRPCIIATNNIYNKKLPVIQVVPITVWNEKKEKVITNIVIEPNEMNGLEKKSIADCLQTRPIDYNERLLQIIGILDNKQIEEIKYALKVVFALR